MFWRFLTAVGDYPARQCERLDLLVRAAGLELFKRLYKNEYPEIGLGPAIASIMSGNMAAVRREKAIQTAARRLRLVDAHRTSRLERLHCHVGSGVQVFSLHNRSESSNTRQTFYPCSQRTYRTSGSQSNFGSDGRRVGGSRPDLPGPNNSLRSACAIIRSVRDTAVHILRFSAANFSPPPSDPVPRKYLTAAR